MISLLLPPPLVSHWLLSMPCQTISTDVICLPIHPGFSLNVFPDAFKNWPQQTTDFSSQCFSLSVEVTPNTVCRKAATVLCFTFSTAHSNSPGSLRLCVGACSSLQHPMHPTHSCAPGAAWNYNSAQLEILSRILLIANCLENASSFPSDHTLHFPHIEQTCLVSTSLFLPCFYYFPNFR